MGLECGEKAMKDKIFPIYVLSYPDYDDYSSAFSETYYRVPPLNRGIAIRVHKSLKDSWRTRVWYSADLTILSPTKVELRMSHGRFEANTNHIVTDLTESELQQIRELIAEKKIQLATEEFARQQEKNMKRAIQKIHDKMFPE